METWLWLQQSLQGAAYSMALAFHECQAFQSLTCTETALLAGFTALNRRLLLNRAAPARGQVCSCELHQPAELTSAVLIAQ